MAQRRMVHHNIWSSEQVGYLSPIARLLYLGTITLADDEGLLKLNPVYLKSQILPYDNLTSDDILNALQEILKNGLLVNYEVDGILYGYHPKWKTYQTLRKDRLKDSNIPKPDNWQPDDNQMATECPPKIREEKISKEKKREDNTPESLKTKFQTNPLWETILKEYPDRNYDLQFSLMCDWWKTNRGSLPKQISAWSNWLSKTKPDEVLLKRRLDSIQEAEKRKRDELVANTKPAKPETLAKLREQMKTIGKKI